MRHLHFISNLGGSIGEISTILALDLKKHFILTRDWEDEEPIEKDILLCHFLNLNVTNSKEFNDFKFKVLIQPIDGTRIYPEYIESFNKYDLIICPANASTNILTLNGVTTRKVVIPNWYEEDIYEKPITSDIEKYLPQDKIIFYHESTFHPRKGIEMLYEGYLRAFSDTEYANKVLLVLKDTPFNSLTFNDIEKYKRDTIELSKQFKHPAKIIKFSEKLEKDDLKILWNRSNFYVSLSKIEGFGIPMLRHFILKKSIICLENPNSGYNDFLNQDTAYMITSLQVKAKNEVMKLYTEESTWAVANITDVIKTFKKALEDYLEHKEKNITSGYYNNSNGIYKDFNYNMVLKLYVKTLNNLV